MMKNFNSLTFKHISVLAPFSPNENIFKRLQGEYNSPSQEVNKKMKKKNSSTP